MKSKFLKYWKEIPMLYAFAFILDPRAKMRGFLNVMAIYSDMVGIDYNNYCSEVRTKLFEVFEKYQRKFQGVRSQRPPTIPTAGKKKMQWRRIWGGSSSSSTSSPSTTASACHDASELTAYLDSDAISHNTEDFNILSWWNDHK